MVDFIGYGDLFIGNVADIAVVAAAVMIAILSVQGIGIDGQRHVEETAATAEAGDDASPVVEHGPDAPAPGAGTRTAPGAGPQASGTTGSTTGTES